MATKTTRKKQLEVTPNGAGKTRVPVQKTYKLYIGGQFPRTESGRYLKVLRKDGTLMANVCRASRKDFRNAVVAARSTAPGWASRTAFNRSQILYRVAEMLESRKAQFTDEMMQMGYTRPKANAELDLCVDRMVYYAGWADKYQQLFSTVNPVSGSYFNFSLPEPMGVVAILVPQDTALLGLVSVLAPAIAGANTVVALASETYAPTAITFAEVLNDSDLPAGVANLLTGKYSELYGHFSTHMDVNAIIYCGNDEEIIRKIRENAATNVKRPVIYRDMNWSSDKGQSPYFILDTQEIKTTWHPIEQLGKG